MSDIAHWAGWAPLGKFIVIAAGVLFLGMAADWALVTWKSRGRRR